MPTAGATNQFFPEELEQIEHDLYEGYLPKLTLEDTINSTMVNPGVVALTRTKVIGMSDAEKIDDGAFFPKDVIEREAETRYLESTGLGFDITRKAVEIARLNGLPIESMYVQSIGRRIAEGVEDEALTFFADIATANSQTFSTTTAWGDTGFNPYNDMVDLQGAFDDVGSELTHVFLNPQEYRMTLRKDADGVKYINDIRELGITLVKSRRVAPGGAVGLNANNCQYVYSNSMNLDYEYKLENRTYAFTAWIEGAPDVLSYRDVMAVDLTVTV